MNDLSFLYFLTAKSKRKNFFPSKRVVGGWKEGYKVDPIARCEKMQMITTEKIIAICQPLPFHLPLFL